MAMKWESWQPRGFYTEAIAAMAELGESAKFRLRQVQDLFDEYNTSPAVSKNEVGKFAAERNRLKMQTIEFIRHAEQKIEQYDTKERQTSDLFYRVDWGNGFEAAEYKLSDLNTDYIFARRSVQATLEKMKDLFDL